MKIFRYRKPSVNRMLGITKVKKAVRKTTGINAVARYSPSRIKQRMKQRVGLYSPTMRTIRQTSKGKFPMPMVPEISLSGSKVVQKASNQEESGYEVGAKKLEEMKCPRCGYILGEPIKESKGLFFKKELQYFLCNGCGTKYNIHSVSQSWKCDYCSEVFSSKDACEEHEKTHKQS